MNVNIRIAILIVFTTIACTSYSQKSWIKKSDCSDSTISGTIYKGFRLEIYFLKDNDTTKSYYYWYDNPFLTYSDSSKLLIIQQLLAMEGDTSLFCGSAGAHFYGGALSCKCDIDNNINVPLQIDALYRINAIAFPHLCHIYSCYPVLYDTLERKIINDKPELVVEVYATYIQWFKECSTVGKIGNYFPFNEGRYIWFCGRKSFHKKGE